MDRRHKLALEYALSVIQEKYGEYINEAYLYGSCARGEENYDSDVDTLLFIKDSMPKEKRLMIGADTCPDDFTLPDIDIHIYLGSLEEKEDNCFFTNIKTEGQRLI